MDDTTFEYDRSDVATVARRFPAHRLDQPAGHPGDVRFLSGADEFQQHAWDEGGHL